jgi:hypothetical protein
MTPVTDKLLEEMTRKIVETVNPRQVVLFGSTTGSDKKHLLGFSDNSPNRLRRRYGLRVGSNHAQH